MERKQYKQFGKWQEKGGLKGREGNWKIKS